MEEVHPTQFESNPERASSIMAEASPTASADTASPSSSKAENATGTIQDEKRPPPCIIVIGMAGSGKTTFVQV